MYMFRAVLLILRSNCINTASGIVTLSKWPFRAQVEKEQKDRQPNLKQLKQHQTETQI